MYLVYIERLSRRAVDDRSRGDVEAGAVALTHDRHSCEQARRERARLGGAGTEIVEGVQPIFDTRD